MITTEQYFGHKPHGEGHTAAALDLLGRRNALRVEWCQATGKECPIDPDTGTEISGTRGGNGDGGFRLATATTGKLSSSHKEARAVDDYDGPGNDFDAWLDQFEVPMPDGSNGGNTKLEQHGLYREHPDTTLTWVHLSTRAPGSGKRTFQP